MGYDGWTIESDEDTLETLEESRGCHALFTDHWSELTDEEVEDRANAALDGW